MSQTHIIENGVVVNTIMATVPEAQAAYPQAVCIEATSGSIGWLWDGATLTAPPAPPAPPKPIPTSVTMRQARLALLAVDLLDDVEAAVAAAGRAAQIEWEYATDVQRSHPLIAAVQAAKGLSNADVDALFVAASEM